MQNRFYRCINLDGVFEISSNIPSGPMLLIDDIFDSGWTFTVISALLRNITAQSIMDARVQAGEHSGKVRIEPLGE